MSEILVTVAICTRDRADRLRRVLQSMAEMIVPDGLDWELIVVDNGSSDHTPEVIESFAQRLPIRRVLESRPGLSIARNCAVSQARGSYLCWTDDDVVVDKHWLEEYTKAFAAYPEAAFFGGRIIPKFEEEPPGWFTRNRTRLSNLLAERDLGDDSIQLDGSAELRPYGANFAVRMAEQKLHLYDPQLGVSPSHNRVGEESAVLYAIAKNGGSGRWVPQSIVTHMIPKSRQTVHYVAVYEQAAGETWAYLSLCGGWEFAGKGEAVQLDTRKTVPRWVRRKLLVNTLCYEFYRRFSSSDAWLQHWQELNFMKGAIAFLRGASSRN